jgi:DNA-3-methyladenine glycosylase
VVARQLIGVTVLIDGVGGRIVETEAYDREDPGLAQPFPAPPSATAMFGPPAHAYVYRSYGIHWCLNFVCREEGHGAGVLIRAIEPLAGLDVMRERRGRGRRAAAVFRTGQAVPGAGRDARASTAARWRSRRSNCGRAAGHRGGEGPRIGISKAIDVPWRFGLAGSRFVSKPFR